VAVFLCVLFFVLTLYYCFFSDIGWWLADGREGVDKRERSFSGEFHATIVDDWLGPMLQSWFSTRWSLYRLMLCIPRFDQSSVCRLTLFIQYLQFVRTLVCAKDSNMPIMRFCCGACFALLSVVFFNINMVQFLWQILYFCHQNFDFCHDTIIVLYEGQYFAHVWC